MPRRTPSARLLLSATVLALVATSLLPTSVTRWIGEWFRGPMMTIIAPISGPMSGLSTWLRPGDRLPPRDADTPQAELIRQRDDAELRYLRVLDRVQELEALVRDLQRGVLYTETPSVRREARRVGSNIAGGTMDIDRGRRHGVREGSIAIARGSEQLVGIVTKVEPMTSTIHLITDTRLEPGLLDGVVMSEGRIEDAAALADLPQLQLEPGRDGLLVSESVGVNAAGRMVVGRQVRLMDDSWPSTARMLVLGRIVRIEETEDPLFRRVLVQPEIEPARLRSVILAIPEGDDEGAAP
jgi:hypothetical protein